MGYHFISTGGIFREIAKEKGMSVLELNEQVQKDIAAGRHDVDDLIDNKSAELGRTQDNTAFDSRLAWHFVPDAFKVFLTVDIGEAARRIMNDGRETEQYSSMEECRAALLERQSMEQARFAELYGVDYYNLNNYNVIVETTSAAPEVIAKEIISQLEQYQKEKFEGRILLNPKSIYPTQSTTALEAEKQNGKNVADGSADKPDDYESVSAGIKNNEWYLIGETEKLQNAIADAQPFVYADVQKNVKIPEADMEHIKAFEKKAGFQYRRYPVTQAEDNILHF